MCYIWCDKLWVLFLDQNGHPDGDIHISVWNDSGNGSAQSENGCPGIPPKMGLDCDS